jgi:hypothetical protein
MPVRKFSGEGAMGLRSCRYADGTATLRAVVAANSSIADGVASALKPRRTRVIHYPAAATARAKRISKAAFQGFLYLPFLSCAGTGRQFTGEGCKELYRSDRKPARTSSEKSCGGFHAA